MEKFQGPTNPCFYGENMDVERGSGLDFSYGVPFMNIESFRFQEEEQHQSLSLSIPISLEDKMPFLQMSQSVESPLHSPFAAAAPPPTSTHFPALLTLQQQQQEKQRKPWERKYSSSESVDESHRIQGSMELESCITNEMTLDPAHSPVKSETNKHWQQQACPNYAAGSSVCCNGELGEPPSSSPEDKCDVLSPSPTWVLESSLPSSSSISRPKTKTTMTRVGTTTTNTTGHEHEHEHERGERRKRKRTRPNKNREEVESQRMNHIAVERNRRRHMNDHLNALRSLMPSSFIQRGDQASIIGGAIDFVKELEQLLQSLEAKKSMRISSSEEEEGIEEYKYKNMTSSRSSSSCSSNSLIPFIGFFSSPQYTSYSSSFFLKDTTKIINNNKCCKCECVVADIEVIVVQTHVNLKILSPTRPGQLLRAIAALEDLRLTILHLNVTSLQHSVLYSFNLKIEEDCKLGTSSSADEIATAVHQILSYINGE